MRPGGSRPIRTLRDTAIALLGVLVLALLLIASASFLPGWIGVILLFLSVPAYRIWFDWSDMKRRRGINPNACPACGYDRTGLPQTSTGPAPCPECGKN